MKNKKGFTLVELLAVIVIIALIGGLGAVAYTSLIRQSEKSAYEAYESTMKSETIALLTKHVELIPANGSTKKFSLSDIKIDPINNPRNKNDLCSDSYVLVTRNDVDSSVTHVDAFTYKICLICNDYNSDKDNCRK